MDVSGVVFRQVQSISGDLFNNNTHSSKLLLSGRSISAGKCVSGDLSYVRSRDFLGVSCSGFSDNGHLQYYVSPPKRCGVKKEIVKKEKKAIKKKLKLAKGLMKNLSAYSEMGFPEIVVDDHSIGNQQEKKMISSTTELLLAQLEKLKAEEKEIKRKQKEEKAKLKVLKMESKEESSSSSSESSDSDCGGGQVIDMNTLRRKRRSTALLEPKVDHLSHAEIKEETSSTIISTTSLVVVADEQKKKKSVVDHQNSLRSEQQQCCSTGISNAAAKVEGISVVTVGGASADQRLIDVCMGGKCKKLGAAALLEEFKTKVGIESGAVVGCKCMGKCKTAPNVRVSNQIQGGGGGGGGDTSVRTPSSNPLYIGVGLEDVNAIVANFFGEDEDEEKKELGFMPTA